MKTAVGRWQIEFDPELTAQCYAEVPFGWDCHCAACRNFFALEKNAFPQAALDLFDRLGVDYRKPAEIGHTSLLKNGLHDYAGWFHFVGEIESGADAWKQLKDPSSFQGDLEALGNNFRFGFSKRLALIRDPFRDRGLVQLEFNTQVPWVLPEPQPS